MRMENSCYKFLFLATLFCGIWVNCASWQPRELSVEAKSVEIGSDKSLIEKAALKPTKPGREALNKAALVKATVDREGRQRDALVKRISKQQSRIDERFVKALEKAEKRHMKAMKDIEQKRFTTQTNLERRTTQGGSRFGMSGVLGRKQLSEDEYQNALEKSEGKLKRLQENAKQRYRDDVRKAKMQLKRGEKQLEELKKSLVSSDNSSGSDISDESDGRIIPIE